MLGQNGLNGVTDQDDVDREVGEGRTNIADIVICCRKVIRNGMTVALPPFQLLTVCPILAFPVIPFTSDFAVTWLPCQTPPLLLSRPRSSWHEDPVPWCRLGAHGGGSVPVAAGDAIAAAQGVLPGTPSW